MGQRNQKFIEETSVLILREAKLNAIKMHNFDIILVQITTNDGFIGRAEKI